MTSEELIEIVEPLRGLNALELHRRLGDLKLPADLEHRVRAELQKRRQSDIVARAFADGDLVAAGTSVDDMIDSIFGLKRVTR